MSPAKVQRQGDMHGEMKSEEIEVITRVTRSDPFRDILLWGIPNEVTLNHIFTKLPRSAYEEVAKVNPEWQRAFQGRMVYDARVRSQATQEFLLVSCKFLTNINHVNQDLLSFPDHTVVKRTLSFFSPSEERWYNLPPIPGCHEGMLHNASPALLDGSIYLLGGTRRRTLLDVPNAEVDVLDLGRHPFEWRRCANMQVPRLDPDIYVMHGKMFVFGGLMYSEDVQFEVQSEVYDPKVDAWSFIAIPGPHTQFSESRPRHPVTDLTYHDDIIDTNFVVTVDNRGPKIRSTSDVDAEDDMDGLHEIIENEVVDQPVVGYQRSPAEILVSAINYHSRSIRIYDTVKDEWREFDKEILGTANVDEYRLKYKFNLRQDDDGSEGDDDGPDPDDDVRVTVWSMSL